VPADEFIGCWIVSLDELDDCIQCVDVTGRPTEHRDDTAETICWHTGILQQTHMKRTLT